MATGTVAVLMKIGFISEEMTKPRQLSGVSKNSLFDRGSRIFIFLFAYRSLRPASIRDLQRHVFYGRRCDVFASL